MSGARERLAEYLEHHRGSADTSDELADALLPVVQALVAEELREAAADVDDGEFSTRESAAARTAILARADRWATS